MAVLPTPGSLNKEKKGKYEYGFTSILDENGIMANDKINPQKLHQAHLYKRE